jgi:hypothetical protein
LSRYCAYLLPLCFALLLPGCQHGPLPTAAPEKSQQQTAGESEQEKLLKEILEYQQKTGNSLESLVKEIERRKAIEQQAMGPSPLERDLMVARALLVSVRRAVNSEDREAALPLLRRLAATIDVMQAEAPAAQIRTYLERAGFALQGSTLGVEADVASASILAALDCALKSPNAALVPPIVQELEATKKKVDGGNYKEALGAILKLIGTADSHTSVRLLDQCAAGVRGAREAMERDAGLVVLAELDQLSDLFNRFSTMLKSAPPPQPAAAQPAEATNAESQPAPTVPPEGEGQASPAASAPERGAAPK